MFDSRDYRGGNRGRGGRGRDRGDRGRGRDRGFDRGRPELFDTVCDECGKECQVPFKPTGDKPVYCDECFERLNPRRRDDNFRGDRGGDRGRGRDRGFDRGSDRGRGGDSSAQIAQLKEHLSNISGKLDKILRILEPVVTSEEIVIPEVAEEKEVKKATKAKKKKATDEVKAELEKATEKPKAKKKATKKKKEE